MAKKATKAAENVYYQARMNAAKWNDRLASREGSSELTGIDRTRIAYIELGTITPYPEEILVLSEYYNAPELCNHYCSHQLLSSIRNLPQITDDLVDIVEDGQIDRDEQEQMETILRQLRQAANRIKALELIYEKRLHAQQEGAGH